MAVTAFDRWRQLQEQLPESARLLAVSKGHPAQAVRELAGLGQRAFGESRLQEALPKQEQLADLALEWHFIGRLQSNKVRGVVRAFSVIHSLDSLALAERVSRIAGEETCHPQVLLQVKLRPRSQQGRFLGGGPAGGLDGPCAPRAPLDHWPDDHGATGGSERTAGPSSRTAGALADRLELADCSMGMSGDWFPAAQQGGTLQHRVGPVRSKTNVTGWPG